MAFAPSRVGFYALDMLIIGGGDAVRGKFRGAKGEGFRPGAGELYDYQ